MLNKKKNKKIRIFLNHFRNISTVNYVKYRIMDLFKKYFSLVYIYIYIINSIFLKNFTILYFIIIKKYKFILTKYKIN